MREGEEVWRGKIASLKRFKDDVSEVRQGTECGIDLGSFKDLRVGDLLETFTTEKLADELGQNVRKAAAAASAARNQRKRTRKTYQAGWCGPGIESRPVLLTRTHETAHSEARLASCRMGALGYARG